MASRSGSSAGDTALGDRGEPDVQGLGGQARGDRDVQVLQPGPAARHRGERGERTPAATPSPRGSPPAGPPAAASPPPACAGPPGRRLGDRVSAGSVSLPWSSTVRRCPGRDLRGHVAQRRVQGARPAQPAARPGPRAAAGRSAPAPWRSPLLARQQLRARVAPAGRGPGVDLAALEVPVKGRQHAEHVRVAVNPPPALRQHQAPSTTRTAARGRCPRR